MGHVRNILLGNALANFGAANVNRVVKTNIVNDRGIHICKSMLAWQKYGNGETPETSGKNGVLLIGDYYVAFDKHYKAEVKELMAKFQREGLNEEDAKAKADAEAAEQAKQEQEAKQKAAEEKKAEEAKRKAEEEKKKQEEERKKQEEEKKHQEEDDTTTSTGSCTLTIECHTLLDNLDNVKEAKQKYVPASGVILKKTKVPFTEGETVYDILKRTCKKAGIQLEVSYSGGYGSYYVEGIGHLYEFDCGRESGWVYRVNGKQPNYGCSSCVVQKGDNIVWSYTCTGMGKDV